MYKVTYYKWIYPKYGDDGNIYMKQEVELPFVPNKDISIIPAYTEDFLCSTIAYNIQTGEFVVRTYGDRIPEEEDIAPLIKDYESRGWIEITKEQYDLGFPEK